MWAPTPARLNAHEVEREPESDNRGGSTERVYANVAVLPVVDRIQDRAADTREYTPGEPARPQPLPQLTTPIRRLAESMSGPPESPWHESLFTTPPAQSIVLSTLSTLAHVACATIGTFTWRSTLDAEPPSVVSPQPSTFAVEPAAGAAASTAGVATEAGTADASSKIMKSFEFVDDE
ncbi:hypothetical protein PybrP1_001869 [[Pythium] brassicae (nom. inval.)]|nr:hypothetical protein PybrP1_001869 [[Pythium] brassicae (nom. inval.)]